MISMLIQFELTDPRSVPENGELYCKLLNSAHLSETRVLLRGPQLRGAKLSRSEQGLLVVTTSRRAKKELELMLLRST